MGQSLSRHELGEADIVIACAGSQSVLIGAAQVEAAMGERDLDGDDVAALGLGRGVVGLDELHDVDAVLTERGADRRGRGRCASVDLQLDEPGDLLLLGGHVPLPSLWADAVGDVGPDGAQCVEHDLGA